MKRSAALSVLTILALSPTSHAFMSAYQSVKKDQTGTQPLSARVQATPATCTDFSGDWKGTCKITAQDGTSETQNGSAVIVQKGCEAFTPQGGSEIPFGILSTDLATTQDFNAAYSQYVEWTDNNTSLTSNSVALAATSEGTAPFTSVDKVEIVNKQLVVTSVYDGKRADCTYSK